jgi:hypothetical protein
MTHQQPQTERDQPLDPKAAIAMLIRELHLVPVATSGKTGGGYGAPAAVEVPARVSLV